MFHAAKEISEYKKLRSEEAIALSAGHYTAYHCCTSFLQGHPFPFSLKKAFSLSSSVPQQTPKAKNTHLSLPKSNRAKSVGLHKEYVMAPYKRHVLSNWEYYCAAEEEKYIYFPLVEFLFLENHSVLSPAFSKTDVRCWHSLSLVISSHSAHEMRFPFNILPLPPLLGTAMPLKVHFCWNWIFSPHYWSFSKFA